ncbi:MAG: Hsp33 family molecular chaperone HslO [Alphaproteobacteria bacterium]|jgi:molecular chaperone Hsp33|nr:Hsp33 family molecular chaperone HslO [Alphaproteobacteria bacterium]
MDNILLPFMLEKTNVRGRITKLGSTVDDIINKHKYPKIVNKYLAELIAVCSSLAGMLKYEGIFTLQTSGDGEISMLVVDIDSNGNIRAYAKYNDNIAEDLTFEQALGKGYIAFTVDQAGNAKKYQGLVEIQQGSFEDCIKHYFESSEQVETSIKSYSEEVDGKWRAGSIIIQKLPEEEKADFNETNIYLDTCMDSELIDGSITSKDLLYRLFHELKVIIYDEKELHSKCRCSEAKILGFLKTLPENEIDSLIQDGKIDVNCEFCSTKYEFKKKDII